MNRRVDCKLYRIREELEDVLDPWPMKRIAVRTHSDVDVTQHGAHLPMPVPAHRSVDLEVEGTTLKKYPLRTRYLPETVKIESEPKDEKWIEEVVDEAMQALDTEDVLPPDYFMAAICEKEEEPDESWEMLDSEKEAFGKFEAFRQRIDLHFSDDGLKKPQISKIPPFEISPPKKTQDTPAYVDKRCNDKRKMIPQVYAAPPYPQYWLPRKKPVKVEEPELKEISTTENVSSAAN